MDIAPDAPTVTEALTAQFNECAVSSEREDSQNTSNGESGSCSRSGTTGSTNSVYADSCNCDGYWYGSPNVEDCRQVLMRLPDYGTTSQKLREFLPVGAQPLHQGVEGPPVRTPIIYTSGL